MINAALLTEAEMIFPSLLPKINRIVHEIFRTISGTNR